MQSNQKQDDSDHDEIIKIIQKELDLHDRENQEGQLNMHNSYLDILEMLDNYSI